ncbi:MBL fold metallo-hydrolase [Streptomyces broussonetiae]|uniref:MBL fold metallo-hydrolase n=1 Tax=Streptomyces broussonetiae TaxID=2686304 RepID=UPI0022784FBF|nr:MBL fold metallo-hydrolase [Streptomyces broussonetiae]
MTSASGAAGLCHETRPEQLTMLARSGGPDAAGAYVARHFAHFDFAGVTVTAPTRTIQGREEVKVGTVLVELIDLEAGHSAGDVAVHLPEEGVVFAGDALFSGAHMVVWSGSLSGCIRACQTLLDTGAELFVPGHGTLLDRSGVADIRDGLARVAEEAAQYARRSVPLA